VPGICVYIQLHRIQHGYFSDFRCSIETRRRKAALVSWSKPSQRRRNSSFRRLSHSACISFGTSTGTACSAASRSLCKTSRGFSFGSPSSRRETSHMIAPHRFAHAICLPAANSIARALLFGSHHAVLTAEPARSESFSASQATRSSSFQRVQPGDSSTGLGNVESDFTHRQGVARATPYLAATCRSDKNIALPPKSR
jgi:hypothetical protein